MDLSFSRLEKLSDVTLQMLYGDSLEVLYQIQKSKDYEDIRFWSDVNAMVRAILDIRKNG